MSKEYYFIQKVANQVMICNYNDYGDFEAMPLETSKNLLNSYKKDLDNAHEKIKGFLNTKPKNTEPKCDNCERIIKLEETIKQGRNQIKNLENTIKNLRNKGDKHGKRN